MTENRKEPFFTFSQESGIRAGAAHYHVSSAEILRVDYGEIALDIGTEHLAGKQGDIFYIPAGTVHRIDAVPEKDMLYSSLIFRVDLITPVLDALDSELFYMFDVQSRSRPIVLESSSHLAEAVSSLMREVSDEYAAKDVCYKMVIRSRIYALTVAYLRDYCHRYDDDEQLVYHNVLRLRPVLEYISVHYREKMKIETLSEMVMLSPDYFTKLFRDSIGKTPIEYINGLRIGFALSELLQKEKTLEEIATSVGFSGSGYFHKMFKQYMGISPSAYRANLP